MNAEEFRGWLKKQLDEVARYVFKKGVLKEDIQVETRWFVPQQVLLAEVWPKHNAEASHYWVITGGVPTDHISLKQASSPREAVRHFCLRWQLQGARIRTADDGAAGDRPKGRIDWTAIADGLADKAEYLYALTEDDRYWKPLPVNRA
ncbi:MAG TPA: DUF4826 family protein [Gammaproteobacteria bacterium]|nr:DUF4826 family protein [Gammaproteobacteria bacterium]